MQDIFEVQDEITQKIISALQVNLTGRSVTNGGTTSVEAYELSLRGRAKFFMFSPETNEECIELHKQSIAIVPLFASAWAERVFPYQSGWSFAWPGHDEGLAIAKEKAEKAVELAPDSSFAHSRMAWVQTFLDRRELSIESFEKALEIVPNNADTHSWFGESLNLPVSPNAQ